MKSREMQSRGKTGQGVEMTVHLINTRNRKTSYQKTKKFKILYNFIINTIKLSHWAFGTINSCVQIQFTKLRLSNCRRISMVQDAVFL